MSLPDGLANEKTFAAKLSNATKRPVYNRSYHGWGIQHMLYQLEDPKTFEELPEPEYVIFSIQLPIYINALFTHTDLGAAVRTSDINWIKTANYTE